MPSSPKPTVIDIMNAGPVIPVLGFESADEAVDVCKILYGAGIKVLEITLRHPTALKAIAAVKAALPADALVGAGTVLTPELAHAAKEAGAVFGVSPGLTEELAHAVKAMDWPFLPGIATLSEAMTARELGFTELKFFPASISGGPDFIKAVGTVLPDLTFCPTGGVSAATAGEYRALDNVQTVGGSWITKRGKDGKINLDMVSERAKAVFA